MGTANITGKSKPSVHKVKFKYFKAKEELVSYFFKKIEQIFVNNI